MHNKEITVGQQAPTFSAKDHTGQVVNLANFYDRQAVVLVFYPGDLTPGCTIQLCAIRDDWQKFQDMRIALFAVNHAGQDSHLRFAEKNSLPMPLLIDPTKKVSTAFGALRSVFGVKLIRRRVVGIDKQGIIRYIKNGMPKNSDILKAMKPFV